MHIRLGSAYYSIWQQHWIQPQTALEAEPLHNKDVITPDFLPPKIQRLVFLAENEKFSLVGFIAPVFFNLQSKNPKGLQKVCEESEVCHRDTYIHFPETCITFLANFWFLYTHPSPYTTHACAHTEADTVEKIREDLRARWKCLHFFHD